jgi:hypothetical protein
MSETVQKLTYHQKSVFLIEFRNGKIVNLVNSEGEIFCFDWSEKLKQYLVPSEANDSISGECWVSETYRYVVKSDFPNIVNIDLPFPIEEVQKHLDESYPCEETIYCKICQSAYDKDDFYYKHGGDYCTHINWSEEEGEFAGCGYSEDNWEDYKESFLRLLDFIKHDVPSLRYSIGIHQYYFSIRKQDEEYSVYFILLKTGQTKLHEALLSQMMNIAKGNPYKYWEGLHKIPDIEKGILWLKSLWSVDRWGNACDETPTTLADETTVQWIEEWESLQKTSNQKQN